MPLHIVLVVELYNLIYSDSPMFSNELYLVALRIDKSFEKRLIYLNTYRYTSTYVKFSKSVILERIQNYCLIYFLTKGLYLKHILLQL